MKPTRDDMSARKQADCVTRAYAAVWSAELFGSGLDVIDCIFHGPERHPPGGLGNLDGSYRECGSSQR